MIVEIDVALKKWGQFYADGKTGLGFPSRSSHVAELEGRDVTCGDGFVPADVERIELAVLAMDDDLRAVVKEFYMTGHRTDVLAIRLTKQLGRKITRQRMFELIDRAHYFVLGAVGVKL